MIIKIIEYLFWVLVLLGVNSYLAYPLIMYVISKVKKHNVQSFYQPKISILISAYNEEKVIQERVENISEQNYEFDKVEVLIGSDYSTDRTNQLLKDLSGKYIWLKIFIFEQRRGKAGVLNDLMREAKNEILVFTDANTHFKQNAIRNLVSHFSDKKVGGVCGKLVLRDEDIPKSEGVEERKYWELENVIKNGEGKLGTVIGANGGIFAIRRELQTHIPLDKPVTDDLFLSLSVLNKGYKFKYESTCVAEEDVGGSIEIEYKRKVRFAATNFQTLILMKNLLVKNPLASYNFFSHKIIRWFLPTILIFIFIFNLILLQKNEIIYELTLLCQFIFYLFGLIGYLLSKLKIRVAVFSLPYFFLMANFALFRGFIKFLSNKHTVVWNSTER